MAKYAILKAERDEAIARAVEAERLSNLATVRALEAQVEALTAEVERQRTALRRSADLLGSCHWRAAKLHDAATQAMAPVVALAADLTARLVLVTDFADAAVATHSADRP